MYNLGMFDQILGRGKPPSEFTIVSYHIARDFLETLKRYVVDTYTYKYHRYTNTLELSPTPPTGVYITVDDVVYESPGFILLKCYTIEGTDEDLYDNMWIFDYATALSKYNLGMIRRKFASFQGLGNMNVQLDGDLLISESREEIERLEEQLKSEEVFEGWPILQG